MTLHPPDIARGFSRSGHHPGGGVDLVHFVPGAALIFRGKTWQGIGSLVFFCGIAVVVEIVRATDVSSVVIGTFILIGIGVIILVKALIFREE